MTARSNNRDSNIELLRILLMLGIIMLHYNGTAGGFDAVKDGSLNAAILHLLQAICVCAVDIFVMISGYYMCGRETVSFRKPVELIFQVILWAEALAVASIIYTAVSGGTIVASEALLQIGRAFIPSSWFVMLYIVTYLLSPYINRLLKDISIEQHKRLIVTLFIVFAIWACLSDQINSIAGDSSFAGLNPVGPAGSGQGYTIVNFIFMYIIGAYIRRTSVRYNRKQIAAFTVACITALFCLEMLNERIDGRLTIVRSFNNPIVIIYSVAVLVLFKDLSIGRIFWINKLAGASFTVFLLHSFFLLRANVPEYVNRTTPIMLLHICVTLTGIYFICFIADAGYKGTIGKLMSNRIRHKDKGAKP